MIAPELIWNAVTASWLTIAVYTVMAVLLIETALISLDAEAALRQAHRNARKLVATLEVSRPGQIEDLRPALADYIHRELWQRRYRLEAVAENGPTLGLICTTVVIAVVLAKMGAEGELAAPAEMIAGLGAAAGTTALGGIANLLATTQRQRLDSAEDGLRHSLDMAASEASKRRNDTETLPEAPGWATPHDHEDEGQGREHWEGH